MISKVIDCLRIPLAILVIYVHVGVESYCDYDKNSDFFTLTWLFTYICDIISFVASCAVPSFFLISGYLFFRNINKFDFNVYLGKIKSRIHTLVIPYLFWNVLVFLWGCLVYYIRNRTSLDFCGYLKQFDLYEVFVSGRHTGTPYYLIMWYLRDLIFLTFLAPVFYAVFKVFRAFALVVILFLYVSFDYFYWLGTLSIAFFSIGVVIGFYQINIEKILSHPFSKVFFCFSMVMLGIYPFGLFTVALVKVLKILVVFCIFYIVHSLLKSDIKIDTKYASCSFFVYCIHILQPANKVTLLAFSTYLMSNTIGLIPFIGSFLTYLLSPLLTFFICLFIYLFLKKCFPNFIKVISGSR